MIERLLFLDDATELTRRSAATIRRWIPGDLNSGLVWREADWNAWLNSRPHGRGAAPQLPPKKAKRSINPSKTRPEAQQ